jgi:hypothetical protein
MGSISCRFSFLKFGPVICIVFDSYVVESLSQNSFSKRRPKLYSNKKLARVCLNLNWQFSILIWPKSTKVKKYDFGQNVWWCWKPFGGILLAKNKSNRPSFFRRKFCMVLSYRLTNMPVIFLLQSQKKPTLTSKNVLCAHNIHPSIQRYRRNSRLLKNKRIHLNYFHHVTPVF